MTITPLICMLLITTTDGPRVEHDSFIRILADLHAKTRDVTFLFEGSNRRDEGPMAGAGGPARSREVRFQGSYAYRSDGAGMVEAYSKEMDTNRSTNLLKRVLFKNRLEESNRDADTPNNFRTSRPPSPGGPGSLNGYYSPESFFYSWYFRRLRPTPDASYEFLGWEEVGGHSCLKVGLGVAPNNPIVTASRVFYLDMDRGGHPLKVEFFRDGKLESRVDSIELIQIPSPGDGPIWFPVSGHLASFVWEGKNYSQPVQEQTNYAISGTIRLNQGLPDSTFLLRAVSTARGDLRRDYESKPALPYQTDPKSVSTRLDARLAEADKQASRLEASSVARTTWDWMSVVPVGFGLIGVGLLVVIFQRTRGSR